MHPDFSYLYFKNHDMKKLLLILPLFILLTSFIHTRLTWVAIGDSITYLNEHPDETDNRITKGYMTLVTEKLPYIQYTNNGHSGWTSGDIADSIEKLGLQQADVYTIFLGTNDWWQGRQLGTMADYENNTGNQTVYGSFRIIINKLHSLNKSARIILITPMQRADFVYLYDMKNNAYGSYKDKNGQYLEQFADAIRIIGKFEKCNVIDLYHNKSLDISKLVRYKRLKDPVTGAYRNYPCPACFDIPFDPTIDEYPYPVDAIDMTYDGLHPSDEGYAVISEQLERIMKKY
jgi:lysophospholipase L1-like esterase